MIGFLVKFGEVVVLSIGTGFWIRLVADTASTYFSPTLKQIGLEFSLPDHLGNL